MHSYPTYFVNYLYRDVWQKKTLLSFCYLRKAVVFRRNRTFSDTQAVYILLHISTKLRPFLY